MSKDDKRQKILNIAILGLRQADIVLQILISITPEKDKKIKIKNSRLQITNSIDTLSNLFGG